MLFDVAIRRLDGYPGGNIGRESGYGASMVKEMFGPDLAYDRRMQVLVP